LSVSQYLPPPGFSNAVHPITWQAQMMNRTIAALTIAGLFACPLYALAAEKTTEDAAVPPAALPGINQTQGSESKEEKADKKGEEAAGSNSGADSQAMEKDAPTSSDSKDVEQKPTQ